MPTPNFALPLALCLLPACFPAKLIGEDLFADTGTDGVGPGDSTSSDSTSSDSTSSDSTTHDCGPDNSGVYLLALETSLVADSPLQFVMQREGIDAELWPETIRETVTIAPGEIRIVQERKNFGGAFEFRRAYRLRRVG